jgi:hydrogenase maturation protease
MELKRTLIAGFGNVFRRDDGLGPAVVNALRMRLGRPALDSLDDGFDDLGHRVDTIVLHQLVPELAETIKDYGLLIFVDAHVGTIPETMREERLRAGYQAPLVSHQFRPSTVLALSQQMYGRAPSTVLLSLRGYDFDFGETLSSQAAQLVEPAVTRIISLIEEEMDLVIEDNAYA